MKTKTAIVVVPLSFVVGLLVGRCQDPSRQAIEVVAGQSHVQVLVDGQELMRADDGIVTLRGWITKEGPIPQHPFDNNEICRSAYTSFGETLVMLGCSFKARACYDAYKTYLPRYQF